MEKLSGSSLNVNAGQFVKTLQGSVGVGFQKGWHVHKDWFAKTITYDQALEHIETACRRRVEHTSELRYIRAQNRDGKFTICVKDDCFDATEYALGQLSGKLEIPSSTVLREMAKEDQDSMQVDTMVMLFNNYARKGNQEKRYRLRTYDDGTLRAFLTEKYAIIDNAWVIKQYQNLLPGGRLSHWKGDEDTIYGNVLIPDSLREEEDDSDYGMMVSIGNCEIGKRRLSQVPSIFRSICMNGCIWGQKMGEQLNKRHSGEIDYNELSYMMACNISEQLRLNEMIMDTFLDMRNITLSAPTQCVIAAICADQKLDKIVSAEILSQYNDFENHHKSLFGIVNAITRAGQEFPNDMWVNLDRVGGSFMGMSQSKFDKYNAIAKAYTSADLEKVFGSAV